MSTLNPAELKDVPCTVPEGEPVPVGKGSHVYLVDGSGYIFRAFHALPPLTRPSDGLPVGALHGFCQMLWKLLWETKAAEAPTHFAVVFDHSAKTFRDEIFADYKANRPPPPDELVPQFPLIRAAVAAFNVACVEHEGYEADDLIATYGRQALEAGADVTIISSDKDLMQLVRPGLVMVDGMKNRRFGTDEVRERFGVPPEKVVDVLALAGDSIDNIPGVPGIGVKTAAELINTFGDLDTLLERASEIKQTKRRERLIEFADQARLSRQLAKLDDNVPLKVPLEALGVQDPDPETLLGFLREMEFNTLMRRIGEKLGAEVALVAPRKEVVREAEGAAAPATPAGAGTPAAGVAHGHRLATKVAFDRSRYETVTTVGQLSDWITRAYETGFIAIDTQAAPPICGTKAELVGLSMATAPGAACYVPLAHLPAGGELDFGDDAPTQLPARQALDILRPLLEDFGILKIGHNLKDDFSVLQRYGIRLSGFDDVMLISYALDGGRDGHELGDLAMRHLNHACLTPSKVLDFAPGKRAERTFARVPIGKATEYAGECSEVALRLWLKLKPRLVAERMTSVYETLERPLVSVLSDMEVAGIKVDRTILSRLSGTFQQRIAALEAEVHELAGETFNLGSPRQLGVILFDKLKLPGGKRTKGGQWETRAGLLDDLANNEELPENARRLVMTMLEWRQLTKLKSTYTDSLPNFIDPESGRIHTCYALAATTTGRLASSDPNLQNIPIRTKEGREIRSAFIAKEGAKLISADYSQIELRVLAHIADIPQLKQAFADGLDIHAMTASEMFGVPIKGMPGEVRRRAKAINFGIIYGISPFGLANQLGISREEAGQYIKTYFQRFPGIRDYMERTKEFAHKNGYVSTIFGRRIHYPEINTRSPSMRGFLERAAINAPIQGSAADIIRRAMIRIPEALKAAKLDTARMLLQVHDELIFEVANEQVDETIATVRAVMESAAEPAVKLSVPIHVDAKAASNWEAAH